MKKELPLFFIFTLLTFFFFYSFSIGLWHNLFFTAIPIGSLGIGLYHYSKSTKDYGIWLFIIAISICMGAFSMSRVRVDQQSFFWGLTPTKIQRIKGRVMADSVETTNHYQSFKIQLISVSNKDASITTQARGLLLVIAETKRNFFMGQQVTISSSPVTSENSGWMVFCGDNNIITQKPDFIALHWRINLLKSILKQINKHFGRFGPLFKALFLGIKSDIPPETQKAFQSSGTLHLLALSGLHVGIIYMAILLITRIIPLKIIRFILASIFILFYLFLIGPRPSLFRASIMIILFALGAQVKRESRQLPIIALSAIIILLLNPEDALGLSFQFSYAAILGIVILSPYFSHLLKKYLSPTLSMPLAVSLAAQWTVSPLLIYHFSFINPFSILYTLVLTPLITLSLWLGIALLAFSYFLPTFLLTYIKLPSVFIWNLIQTILTPQSILPGITFSYPFLFLCFYGIVSLYFLKNTYGISIKKVTSVK